MAITDELREFKSKIQIYRSPWSLLALRSAINCIADRIDAAHEADVYAAGLAGSIQYELEHCPACKNIADLQEALAENKRLRQENAKLRGARDVWQENDAKLRELVRDVVLLAGVNGCDVTSMQLHLHDGDWRTIADRMHELGIR